MYDLDTINRMNSRQATTAPQVGTVSQNDLTNALVGLMGYSQTQLMGKTFHELKAMASKQVWDYLKGR